MDKRKKDFVLFVGHENCNRVSLLVDKGSCTECGYRHHHRVTTASLHRLWAVLQSNHWRISPYADGWAAMAPLAPLEG